MHVKFEFQPVECSGRVLSGATVLVPREKAASHGVVPEAQAIEQAKAQFLAAGINTMSALIDVIRSYESDQEVLGYFGFTFDRDNLTKTPLKEGETQLERGMKIMRLPHPQWGNRYGNATVLDDLVRLAADSTLGNLNAEQRAVLNEAFAEGATFLAQSTSKGRS